MMELFSWTLHNLDAIPRGTDQRSKTRPRQFTSRLTHEGFVESPDVHVVAERQEIRMYFHGVVTQPTVGQWTRVAVSRNGLDFETRREILGAYYWRAFRWNGFW
jgi:hypothetical protein